MTQADVYGTSWCPQVKDVRAVLDAAGVDYRYHDIDADKKAAKAVYRLQRGSRRVPTVVFADGTVLVEPSDDRLRDHLPAAGEAGPETAP